MPSMEIYHYMDGREDSFVAPVSWDKLRQVAFENPYNVLWPLVSGSFEIWRQNAGSGFYPLKELMIFHENDFPQSIWQVDRLLGTFAGCLLTMLALGRVNPAPTVATVKLIASLFPQLRSLTVISYEDDDGDSGWPDP
ncbi:hypothetical protein K439DRAFT_1617398 [Ramaria rubella]|nr:hypothetical protein K439DRAFT_1617398 [Ramaria rubella]